MDSKELMTLGNRIDFKELLELNYYFEKKRFEEGGWVQISNNKFLM
ncbi:hypothetical protein [Paenibacillus pabuli]|nr:hypothetical protein [Paenibacillus pabuli]UPK41165.1 hypothetical protein KET34_17785 [Paenibacillus pabuli]